MSQVPPYAPPPMSPGMMPPARPGNAWAITSLILGILLCVPLAGLGAVITGVLGIGRSKTSGTGKGMAIAGLVLGFVGIAIWGFVGIGAFKVYRMAAQPRTVAKQFVSDVATGNRSSALANSSMSPAQIDLESAKLKQLGPLKDVAIKSINFKPNDKGNLEWTLSGSASFQQRTTGFHIVIENEGSKFRVVNFGTD